MAKVEMNGFIIQNVEPCPKCGSNDYARREDVCNMIIMCCDKCDYEASGALMVHGRYSLSQNRKKFIELTRNMFNHWNEKVALDKGQKVKRVRIES